MQKEQTEEIESLGEERTHRNQRRIKEYEDMCYLNASRFAAFATGEENREVFAESFVMRQGRQGNPIEFQRENQALCLFTILPSP